MKKFLSIAVLFICQNVFCQEYSFDNFYEFEGNSVTCAVMINSEDNSYYFTCRKDSEKIWGYLQDFKAKILHYYEVANFGNNVKFIYQNSAKMNPSDCSYFEKNMQFDVTTEFIDSTKTKSIIVKNQVNKKGKKKYRGKVELVFDTSNSIFPAKLIPYFGHHFFDCRDLSFMGNKLPAKIIFNYNNGIIVTSKLIKKLKINTTLKIDQINYKR